VAQAGAVLAQKLAGESEVETNPIFAAPEEKEGDSEEEE